LEDGRLTDGQGHTVDFRNSVIVMTSNVGAQDLMKTRSLGFSTSAEESFDLNKMKGSIMEALRKTFRPEFLNRVDDIIIFKPLGREELLQILDIMLKEVETRLKEQGVEIVVPDETKAFLLEQGYDPKYGARPLRRTLQRMVEDKMADMLLEGKISKGSKVEIVVVNGELEFKNLNQE
jgi:ATP-dependent Clp protease ATP-binding subunit ClpC